MSDEDRDTIFDENLRKIAPHLSIPAEPTADQRERWKHPPRKPRVSMPPARRRRALWAFAATGGMAVILAVWLFPFRTTSAQAVLASFQTSLARPMWIELRDIDLGNVSVSGTIFLDGRKAQPQFLQLDAIIHPDNDLWSDVRARVVGAQSGGSAWLLTRQGPADSNEANLLQPPTSQQVDLKADWTAMWADPGGCFGALPILISFDRDEKAVTYRFSTAQRAVLGASIRDLVMLSSNQQSVEELMSVIRAIGDDLSLREQADGHVTLSARNVHFFSAAPPPVSALDLTLQYDPQRELVLTMAIEDRRQDALDVARLGRHLIGPFALDGLLVELRSQSGSVEVDRSKSPWLIRVRQMKAKPWLLESPPLASLDRIDLTIEFDPQQKAVTRAVMSNVGATGGGTIILRFEGSPPAPEWLLSSHWTGDDSDVEETSGRDE